MSASACDLSEVALALRRTCGIVFSDRHGEHVRGGLARAARALGVDEHALLARLRLHDPAALRALVDGSVVGETYFWRHPEQLSALRAVLRREGLRGPLRAWCAGCASGEEAYTMAALLLEEGRAAPGCVLGTDVSEKALEAARQGRYGPWSLRGVPVPARARWLRADGEQWTVLPELRELTAFRRQNLTTDPPPGDGFDVVLCRNVLIYFDAPTARAVLERLFAAIRPGGLLVLAPAENFFARPLGFEEVERAGGVLWRKAPAAVAAPRPVPAKGAAAPPCPRASGANPSPAAPPRAAAATARAPEPAAPPPAGDPLEDARRAAADARWADAERLASRAGEATLLPEPFLYAAAAAEARGDVDAALRWIGRALFLDPRHAVARASLVPLLERRGQREAAARARRQALDALAEIPDEQLLPGVEPVEAGALRDALAASQRLEVSR
jgi:chemotaxis protein methyltransferase CheR